MTPTIIPKGNLATVTDTLIDESGAVVNLTGASLLFIFQQAPGLPTASVNFTKAAVISDAVNGKVSYTFVGSETSLPGGYTAVWKVTAADTSVKVYPVGGGYLTFTIQENLPVTQPANATLLRDLYPVVRAVLGDFDTNFRKYDDSSIADVLRAVVLMGTSPNLAGYGITSDRLGISPALADARTLGALVHRAGMMFVLPNTGAYSYRTRAMSETFGEQRHFVFQLESALYKLECGEMFSSTQSFYAWVSAQTGLPIGALMTDMNTNAPIATVTIGRSGITVSTS